jgi:CcmD family protein
MEANGKIFVVVAVLAVIMTGIFVYLFFLDRKVRRLEKQAEEKPEKKGS